MIVVLWFLDMLKICHRKYAERNADQFLLSLRNEMYINISLTLLLHLKNIVPN